MTQVLRSRARLPYLLLLEEASALGANVGAGGLYTLSGDHSLHYVNSQGTDINLSTGGSGGGGITSLSGDVTATGPGAATAVVTSAGGGTGPFAAGEVTATGLALPLDGPNLLWGAGNGFGTTITNAVAIINNNILTMVWGADNSVTASGAFIVDGASTFNSLATFYGSIFSAGGKFDVNPILTQEIATPTATAGYGSTYTYTDGNLHYMSPTGTDYALTPPSVPLINVIAPTPGASASVSLTPAENGSIIQAGGGVPSWSLSVNMPTTLSSGQAAQYTAVNTSVAATLQLEIPTGMNLYAPGAAGVAGPTTFTTNTPNASVIFVVEGTTSCQILSISGSWTNP